MRLLITAGPTREYLDDVRFLSNASTGRMGCAIARAAVGRGHEVVLICGPLEVAPPPSCVRDVVSTADMLARCREEFPKADALIMAAAPADFRPARRVKGKMKKSPKPLSLRLVSAPDILAELASHRTTQVLVGFALEAHDLDNNARRKLHDKHLDLIVANTPEAIAAERSTVHVLYPDDTREVLDDLPKEAIAERLVEIVERLVAERRRDA
ncbi:MAG TPA: phosphopantothenoylcysteine decarboxylase [Planctomycetota bacterium]|nr:phosphopantothenoylcysteine decarboxylase [Planctomycetota bacterium]